jgi:hypothetical protein
MKSPAKTSQHIRAWTSRKSRLIIIRALVCNGRGQGQRGCKLFNR